MIKKFALTVLYTSVILLTLWYIIKRQHNHTTTLTSTVLKPNEQAKVVIDVIKGKVTMIKRDGTKQVVESAVGVRNASFTLGTDGSMSMDAPQRGFIFEPGYGLQYSDGARLSLDVQFYYWKRWGTLAGISWPFRRERGLRGFVGVSRDIWSNTSGYAGLDNKKDLVVGLRVKF